MSNLRASGEVASSVMKKMPVLRSLQACTKSARKDARIELMWNTGIAFLSVVLVAIVVVITQPIGKFPSEMFGLIGRGELMIYSASLCGPVLYSLRHGMSEAIPDALREYITPKGTLVVVVSTCMGLSMLAYVVRRTSDLNHMHVNEGIIFWGSAVLLVISALSAYVVFAVKRALSSGATIAIREQTGDFGLLWQQEGRQGE